MLELISIIVPVYKVEKYLRRCVSSLTNQTYTNIEIILVDDGSPDLCPQICDQMSSFDKRIKVIHKKNGGLSSARNAGIEMASGRYIMFVDSDDTISFCMVEKLYNSLVESNADISICGLKYIFETSQKRDTDDYSPITDGVISGEDIIKNKVFERRYWYWVVAWNKLYKKEIFEEIRFPIGKWHEDEFIFHKIMLQCKSVACISDLMYNYFQHDSSIMADKDNPRHLDAVEALFLRTYDYLNVTTYYETAVKTLFYAIFLFRDFYLHNSIIQLLKYRKQNQELQKCYRTIYKILKTKIKLNRVDKFKLIGNYISLEWMCILSYIKNLMIK